MPPPNAHSRTRRSEASAPAVRTRSATRSFFAATVRLWTFLADLLAPEDHPFARTHFDTQMRLIDFLWKSFGHPNITLHAGELTLDISPLEAMQSRIRRSVEAGHARRIGQIGRAHV